MTGQMLWLALMGQGIEVPVEECIVLVNAMSRYRSTLGLFLSTHDGRYFKPFLPTEADEEIVAVIINGEVQPIEDHDVFHKAWKKCREVGELS